jgi:AmmeMemoRadiSam system protein A
MNTEQKKSLLELARNAIKKRLLPDTDSISGSTSIDKSKLDQFLGAFVSLHIGRDLKGCIGYILGFQPLHKSVEELAIAAAFNDTRFKPLSVNELDKVNIEISILSELSIIDDISQIVVGKHGLVITSGACKGLLLPQVAVEQGWDREEFFYHGCLKAGINPQLVKKENCLIQVFEAEVFSENELFN